LGASEDLLQNIHGLAPVAELDGDEIGYDGMAIPRLKGKRREVRRMLAQRSQELLAR
jgi:hypothetical protein